MMKNLKSLNLTSNAKLPQSGRQQSVSQEIPGSIPTSGTFFNGNYFVVPLFKPLLPTLPFLYD